MTDMQSGKNNNTGNMFVHITCLLICAFTVGRAFCVGWELPTLAVNIDANSQPTVQVCAVAEAIDSTTCSYLLKHTFLIFLNPTHRTCFMYVCTCARLN